jgi:hypothetical protein
MQSDVVNVGGSYPFHLLASWVYLKRDEPSICTACGRYAEYVQEHYINIFQIQRMLLTGMKQRKAVNIAWNVARDEQLQGVYCCAGKTRVCWECLLKQIGGVNPYFEVITRTLRPAIRKGWVFGHELLFAEDDGKAFLIPTQLATLQQIVSAMRNKDINTCVPLRMM